MGTLSIQCAVMYISSSDMRHGEQCSVVMCKIEVVLSCISPLVQALPQYLPSTAHEVVEECLLLSSLEGLPVPAEVLTDVLQHLCIIGEAALTTAPFPLQHTRCRVFLVPALLPKVTLKATLRTEGTLPHSSTLDRPSTSALPDPFSAGSLPLLILSRSRVLLTTFIPALCHSLSTSPFYASSGVFDVHEVAFNQIAINPHQDVQLNVQVFEPHSIILGSHSGIKVEVGLSPQHLEPVVRHLMHAVSMVEEAYGPVGVEWATPCLQGGDSPHPLKVPYITCVCICIKH